MEEIWRDIEGYEGKYQVSNLGRVKSLDYKRTGNEKILVHKNGIYRRIRLTQNGKQKDFYIHRLVAQAFIPNPNNYIEINHIDEDKQNNKADNLEWCSRRYNLSYGSREDFKKHFSKEYNIETKGKKVICLNTNEEFVSIREASRAYKIHNADISKACRGIYKSAGKHPITGEKLIWMYAKEVTSNA